jgi:hypothetical protein
VCWGWLREGAWLLANTSVSLPHNVITAHFSHFPPLHAPLPRPHSAHSDQQGSHAMANCANRRKGMGKRRNHLVAARGCHPPPTHPLCPSCVNTSFGSWTNYFPKRPSVSFINLPDLARRKIPDRHFRTRARWEARHALVVSRLGWGWAALEQHETCLQ